MRKNIIANAIVALIILGSIGAAYIIISAKKETKKSPKPTRVLTVKAFAEKANEYDLEIFYPAKVVSQDLVELGVEVSGKIERGAVPLKAGQTFKKGDLLFSINLDDINAKLISSKSKFITLISQVLPDIKIDFSSEYSKWEQFFESISFDKPLQELPKINSSKEKVYMASRNIISSYYDIVSQELLMNKHSIRAPFNGVFTSITKEVGAIVSANSKIGTISSTDNLDIVASVSQSEAARVVIGSNATVKSRDGKGYTGKITRVSSYVDPKTHLTDVYINLYEPSRSIIEGEMVDVVIPLGKLKNVIKIPIDALDNNSIIYCVDNEDKIYSLQSKVEYEYGEWIYISGVADGSRIIQESLINPIIGLKVNVIETHID